MQRVQGLFALLALSCLSVGFVQSAVQTLTLAEDGCSGLEFQGLSQKFHYDAQVVVQNAGNASCLSVSKLYVQDACINTRNNELGLNTVKQVTCDQTTDTSSKTCSSVFQSAPGGTIVNGSQANSGGDFDSGDVCAAQDNVFIYAQNSCGQSLDIQVTVTTSDYKGSICLDIAGRHINGVGIALIIAAILIVVVLLALVCYCCCCRW